MNGVKQNARFGTKTMGASTGLTVRQAFPTLGNATKETQLIIVIQVIGNFIIILHAIKSISPVLIINGMAEDVRDRLTVPGLRHNVM